MSDSINGRIGEDEQQPLLVIAEESSEAAPALIVVEEPSSTLPAPAVEALDPAKLETSKDKAPAAPKTAPAPAIEISAAPAAPTSPAAPAPQIASEASPSTAAPLPQPQQESAEAAPVVEVQKPKLNFRRHIPLAAVSLAVFASGLSVVGLLVASRTVAETRLVLEKVQTNQEKMQSLDTLIKRVEQLRKREQVALARVERINAGKPVTAKELEGAIAGLQVAMVKYQLGTGNNTLTNIRDGQYELAERISTLYRRIEKIDGQMSKLPVSSTPKAKTAGDRAPTS
jgi:hypothetical protein